MIIANMATYPPRRDGAVRTVRALAPQLDCLNLVLNQFAEPIVELADLPNLRQIIPEEDTKDVGKFYPDITGARYVLTVDDDIIYPDDFVSTIVDAFDFGSRYMGGYHGSLYVKPRFSFQPRRFRRWMRFAAERIASYREIIDFETALDNPLIVDQLGTGVAIMFSEDFPPYEYMRDSKKFVDVRLARWCFEKGITPVALPRPQGWLRAVRYDETIFESFTKANPPAVAQEIMTYALKVPRRGRHPSSRIDLSEEQVL